MNFATFRVQPLALPDSHGVDKVHKDEDGKDEGQTDSGHSLRDPKPELEAFASAPFQAEEGLLASPCLDRGAGFGRRFVFLGMDGPPEKECFFMNWTGVAALN